MASKNQEKAWAKRDEEDIIEMMALEVQKLQLEREILTLTLDIAELKKLLNGDPSAEKTAG